MDSGWEVLLLTLGVILVSLLAGMAYERLFPLTEDEIRRAIRRENERRIGEPERKYKTFR